MVIKQQPACFLRICKMQQKSLSHSNISGAMLTFHCLTSRNIISSMPSCAFNFF
jgi:hypothetical protein